MLRVTGLTHGNVALLICTLFTFDVSKPHHCPHHPLTPSLLSLPLSKHHLHPPSLVFVKETDWPCFARQASLAQRKRKINEACLRSAPVIAAASGVLCVLPAVAAWRGFGIISNISGYTFSYSNSFAYFASRHCY